MSDVTIERRSSGAGDACAAVLATLPDWFGFAEVNADYAATADREPTIVALAGPASSPQPIGTLTLIRHGDRAAEVLVMGVVADRHGDGVGTAMMAEAEAWLREDGIEYLQVKTLAATQPDPGYEATRGFYHARGFVDLEVFETLWEPGNPALLMVKKL